MGKDKPKPDSQLPDVLTHDAHVFTMLVSTITSEVTTVIEQRRARERTMLLSLCSIGLVLGLAVGGFLINEVLSIRVNRAVTSAVDANLGLAQFQSELAALSFSASQLRADGGFTEDTAHGLIADVDTLYRTADRLQPSREGLDLLSRLRPPLESLALAFGRAGRIDLTQRLEDAAPRIAESSDAFTQVFVQSLGPQQIGEAGAPESWLSSAGEYDGDFIRYRKYVERAKATGYPEHFLVFELIVRHMEGRSAAELEELLQDVDSLNDRDSATFIRLMVQQITLGFVSDPTALSAEFRRAADRARDFVSEYRMSSPTLEIVARDAGIDALAAPRLLPDQDLRP